MNIAPFPQCCKARIIHGFGAGHVNEKGSEFTENKNAVLVYVKGVMEQCYTNGIRVIFACPTSFQTGAIEALEELGWYGAEEPPKSLKDEYFDGDNRQYDLGTYTEQYKEHKIHPMFVCLTKELVESF